MHQKLSLQRMKSEVENETKVSEFGSVAESNVYQGQDHCTYILWETIKIDSKKTQNETKIFVFVEQAIFNHFILDESFFKQHTRSAARG